MTPTLSVEAVQNKVIESVVCEEYVKFAGIEGADWSGNVVTANSELAADALPTASFAFITYLYVVFGSRLLSVYVISPNTLFIFVPSRYISYDVTPTLSVEAVQFIVIVVSVAELFRFAGAVGAIISPTAIGAVAEELSEGDGESVCVPLAEDDTEAVGSPPDGDVGDTDGGTVEDVAEGDASVPSALAVTTPDAWEKTNTKDKITPTTLCDNFMSLTPIEDI